MNSINLCKQYTPSLEERYESHWNVEVNVNSSVFCDHFEPNEDNPEGIRPHLVTAKEGLLASTGGERTVFAFLNGAFQGLVGVDVNPRMKAYNDFRNLLIRISETREEYVALSQPTWEVEDRIEVITRKMDGLPKKVHDYYQRNLHAFASVYLTQRHKWRESSLYEACHYFKDDAQFLKLQSYVRSGNIIYTIGNLNDLEYLGSDVSVIDTSNIRNYEDITFKLTPDCDPIIIVVDTLPTPARFDSYAYCPNKSLEEIIIRNAVAKNLGVKVRELGF